MNLNHQTQFKLIGDIIMSTNETQLTCSGQLESLQSGTELSPLISITGRHWLRNRTFVFPADRFDAAILKGRKVRLLLRDGRIRGYTLKYCCRQEAQEALDSIINQYNGTA